MAELAANAEGGLIREQVQDLPEFEYAEGVFVHGLSVGRAAMRNQWIRLCLGRLVCCAIGSP